MMATELKNRMELSLNVPVSVLDLLKGSSISQLAARMLEQLLGEDGKLAELLSELEQPEPSLTAA